MSQERLFYIGTAQTGGNVMISGFYFQKGTKKIGFFLYEDEAHLFHDEPFSTFEKLAMYYGITPMQDGHDYDNIEEELDRFIFEHPLKGVTLNYEFDRDEKETVLTFNGTPFDKHFIEVKKCYTDNREVMFNLTIGSEFMGADAPIASFPVKYGHGDYRRSGPELVYSGATFGNADATDIARAIKQAYPDRYSHKGLATLAEHIEACGTATEATRSDADSIALECTEYVSLQTVAVHYGITFEEAMITEDILIVPIPKSDRVLVFDC